MSSDILSSRVSPVLSSIERGGKRCVRHRGRIYVLSSKGYRSGVLKYTRYNLREPPEAEYSVSIPYSTSDLLSDVLTKGDNLCVHRSPDENELPDEAVVLMYGSIK